MVELKLPSLDGLPDIYELLGYKPKGLVMAAYENQKLKGAAEFELGSTFGVINFIRVLEELEEPLIRAVLNFMFLNDTATAYAVNIQNQATFMRLGFCKANNLPEGINDTNALQVDINELFNKKCGQDV